MRQTTLLTVTLLFAISCINNTNGHSCYNCRYLAFDGEIDPISDLSCIFEKPDEDLIEECSMNSMMPLNLVNHGDLQHKMATVGEFLASRGLSSKQVVEWGCIKIWFNGDAYFYEKKAKGVLRLCYPLVDEELACRNDTMRGFETSLENGDSFAYFVWWQLAVLKETSKVSACLCGEDNCNVEGFGGNTTAV